MSCEVGNVNVEAISPGKSVSVLHLSRGGGGGHLISGSGTSAGWKISNSQYEG